MHCNLFQLDEGSDSKLDMDIFNVLPIKQENTQKGLSFLRTVKDTAEGTTRPVNCRCNPNSVKRSFPQGNAAFREGSRYPQFIVLCCPGRLSFFKISTIGVVYLFLASTCMSGLLRSRWLGLGRLPSKEDKHCDYLVFVQAFCHSSPFLVHYVEIKCLKVSRWFKCFNVSRFQSFKVTRLSLQGYKVTSLQGFEVTRLQGYKVTTLQGYNVTRLQRYKVTTFQLYNVLRFQCYKVTTLQGYKVTTIKVTRLQGYKVTRLQGYKITSFKA